MEYSRRPVSASLCVHLRVMLFGLIWYCEMFVTVPLSAPHVDHDRLHTVSPLCLHVVLFARIC